MQLIVDGIPPYDGEYEVSQDLTNRELHLIKKVSGVRAGELEEAFAAGDNDLVVAITVITLQRNGFPDASVEAIWDADAGRIRIKETAEDKAAEDADRPLASEDPSGINGGSKSEPDADSSPSEPQPNGGGSGNTDGENSRATPLRTGDPGSVTSADFAQPI